VTTVQLLHVPVALARAWQQHADALLREHLLASFDWETDSIEHLDRQAGAGEAFNALADALAGFVDADDPPEHADIELRLTATQVAGFRNLDFLLDRAAAMAEAGELLAPPTQPEIRRLRRWMSDQAMRQAEGREAVPWLGLGTDDPLAQVRPVEWDPTPVVTAKEAVIAADDSNRILAASPAALGLLGWGAADLVGRRIVAVIPRRLREAHIAAFTLHLLAGRTSILDRAVQVPALRRDGTEVEVDLLVRRQSAGGRAVFVATMTPIG
jgi:PAS domain S-box-containing protein